MSLISMEVEQDSTDRLKQICLFVRRGRGEEGDCRRNQAHVGTCQGSAALKDGDIISWSCAMMQEATARNKQKKKTKQKKIASVVFKPMICIR